MKRLKTKAETRPVEPEQESYPVYCKKPGAQAAWPRLVGRFVEHLKCGLSGRTIEIHRGNLDYWLRFLAETGHRRVSDVTPETVARFQTWLYEYRTQYRRPLALGTQRQILHALQLFFRFLVKDGLLLNDPTEAVRLPRAVRRVPVNVLRPREARKLLAQPNTATALGFRDRTMLEVLYSCGLRVGELVGLRLRDLPGSLQGRGPDKASVPEGCLFIGRGKGDRERLVPVGSMARQYLQEYLGKVRPILARKASPDLVFLAKSGRAWKEGYFQDRLHGYAREAGIKKTVTVHSFRHMLATEMLKAGADIRQVQQVLGHKHMTTTQLYTHLVKGELKRIQQKCHPREQVRLPEGFVRYRGRRYLTDREKADEA